MIPQRQIDEIIEKNDIGDVIGEYVRLERKGSGYMGLCPFHSEKTPSFSVHEGKQIFKCFGCGKAGNVVNFIMYAENLNYPEALEFLAKRAGIELEHSADKRQEDKARLINSIYSVNRTAAKFFYDQLKHNRQAQKYLYDRGLRTETVKQFGLGYAPDSWDALYRHFTESGAAPDVELLVKAGLITKKRDSDTYYDKFRNRVMFPIFDVSGNVIAFGGRVMDDSLPKYLNSPETPAYIKGNHLYGLNIAKKSQSERVIIVEGYMDCIALHKSGIHWAVASLGTALTHAQARLLKRYFKEVIIGYDADGAGQKATLRGLDILAAAGFRIRVLSIPDADPGAKDPDEFLRTHTADEFTALADRARSAVEYRISKEEERYPPTSMESKAAFVRGSVRILASISGDAERDMYCTWFSDKYGISKDSVTSEIMKIRRSGSYQDPEANGGRMPVRNIKNAVTGNNNAEDTADIPERVKQDKLEKTAILLMSDDRRSLEKYYGDIMRLSASKPNRTLLEKLKKRYESGERTGHEAVIADASELPERDVKLLTDIVSGWLRPSDIGQACADIVNRCRILDCDIRISCINEMLNDNAINEADRFALIKETAAIIEERKKYSNGH